MPWFSTCRNDDARRRLLATLVAGSLFTTTAASAPAENNGYVDKLIDRFKNSDIRLGNAASNKPFIPMLYLDTRAYGNTETDTKAGDKLDYRLFSTSQAAGLPLVLSDRDVLVLGEYVNYSRFLVDTGNVDDFAVTSLGLPVGWLRQVNPDWQIAAFVMPMLHHSTIKSNTDNWQTMGGIFSRYVQNEQLWWAFGFFADHAADGDLYLPYIGASWAITPEWSLSAIMPWPEISWAPTANFFVSVGASVSGASWTVDEGDGDVAIDLDGWDFGASLNQRVTGNLWGHVKLGVGGLRGFRWEDADFEGADTPIDSDLFFSIGFEYRPSID